MEEANTEEDKAFSCFNTNQIVLTFPNGNGLSTIWGAGSYNDNRFRLAEDPSLPMSSNTVEVMPECSDTMLKRLQKRYDTTDPVIGYLNIEQWLDIVETLAREKKTV